MLYPHPKLLCLLVWPPIFTSVATILKFTNYGFPDHFTIQNLLKPCIDTSDGQFQLMLKPKNSNGYIGQDMIKYPNLLHNGADKP